MDESPRPSQQRLDQDAAQMLERGDRALQLLSKQVELAKVEARRAELEGVMLQAKAGEVAPLRRWFQRNGEFLALDSPPLPAQSAQPLTSFTEPNISPKPDPKTVPKDEVLQKDQNDLSVSSAQMHSWQTISDRSMRRLQQQFGEASTRTDSSLSKQGKEISKVGANSKFKKAAKLQGPAKEELPKAKIVVAKNLEAAQRDPGRVRRRWGARGVTVSAVVHLVLILALGLVTIQVPVGQGIFQFEASASSQSDLDTLDAIEPLQAAEPLEAMELQPAQWTPSLENALPDLPAVDSAALGESPAAESSSRTSPQSLADVSGKIAKQMSADFFGASATGTCFCFLIDGSATMRGAPWEAARAELIRSLQSLSESQRFYVIFYHRTVNRIPDPQSGQPAKLALYASRENLQHAVRWLHTQRVEATIPGGNQAVVLQAAIELEPDAVFYLTDGEMTESVQRNVLRALRQVNRVSDPIDGESIRIPIHTIAFHSPSGIEVMRRIAEENGGQMTFVPAPATK